MEFWLFYNPKLHDNMSILCPQFNLLKQYAFLEIKSIKLKKELLKRYSDLIIVILISFFK